MVNALGEIYSKRGTPIHRGVLYAPSRSVGQVNAFRPLGTSGQVPRVIGCGLRRLRSSSQE